MNSCVEEKDADVKNSASKHLFDYNALLLEHSPEISKLKTKHLLDINTKNGMINTLIESKALD